MAKRKGPKFTPAMEAALRRAMKTTEVQQKKVKERTLLEKVGRRLKAIFYGKKTKPSKLPLVKKAVKPSLATQRVQRRLRTAGVTEKEIRKLRGKK